MLPTSFGPGRTKCSLSVEKIMEQEGDGEGQEGRV